MKGMLTFTAQQALASGALTHDVVIGTTAPTSASREEYEIESIMLAAASAITQTLTISIIAATGAAYTFVLSTSSLSSATSSVYVPSGGRPRLKKGDTIRQACTNSGTPAITVSSRIQLIPVG